MSLTYLSCASAGTAVKPISKSELRAMTLRGNFGGMVIPGLGLSTHDALFDPMLPWYPQNTQQAILDAKRAQKLNVVNLCSWSDYHGHDYGMPVSYEWTRDFQAARRYCVRLREQGFIPFFWLLGDRVAGDDYDPTGGGCDGALDLIANILPVIKDVVGAISPGFELRGPGFGSPYSAAQYWRMLLLMNRLAPDLYKFGHFVVENSAGSSHSPVEAEDPWQGNEIGFWAETHWPEGSTLLDGFFYQAPTNDKLFGPDEAWRDRWQECLDRIGPDKMWRVDVDCCWGEAGWYDIVRGDHTPQQLESISAEALRMGGQWSFSG